MDLEFKFDDIEDWALKVRTRWKDTGEGVCLCGRGDGGERGEGLQITQDVLLNVDLEVRVDGKSCQGLGLGIFVFGTRMGFW